MLEIDLAKIDMSKLSFNGVTGGNPYAREVPTSLSLYIFAMLYWFYLTWDALRLKNTIQVIGLCISDYALIIYGVVQIKQINDIVNKLAEQGIVVEDETKNQIAPGLIAIPCVLAGGAIAMTIVARKLYDEFAWTIYKNISADLRMKRRYLTYQVGPTIAVFCWRLIGVARSTLPCSSSTSSSCSAFRCRSWPSSCRVATIRSCG